MCQYQECSIAYIGEPSPPSIHGQPSSGKSFKLSITKQDDGGAPILEYIVKYRSVSTLFIIILWYFQIALNFHEFINTSEVNTY